MADGRKSAATAPARISLRSSLAQMRNPSATKLVASGRPGITNNFEDEISRMTNLRSSAVSATSGGQKASLFTHNTISREEFIEHYPQLLLDIMTEDEDEDEYDDKTELLGIDMCFRNLSLSIKLGKNNVKVVDNVTGRLRAKSMTAIMGGSGAGKTSLLNALCGRAYYGETTGTILVNGHEERIEDHKDSVGFVPQDDIVYAELTVRENLIFSGRFRLPKGTRNEEIEELADETLANLGLARVANSPVGDVRRRGVSGGEKKRVNIGLELMALPSICKLLRRAAEDNCVLVVKL
jgi:ABC-type lipoprotein export system ATPase subunit